MRRTLFLMVISALLLTQCRKPAVELPTAEPANTVSMTITAGPGGKTDISTTGSIKWSTDDKIYVGYNGKYVGYLTLQSGAGSATGTFTGSVTLPDGTNGEPFHFFYLGSNAPANLTPGTSTEATVSFASQTGLLSGLSSCHVGYGSANGTVAGNKVTGINVTLVSKVALARFSFTDGTNPYTGQLTLSGTGIYNSMTVGFGGTFTGAKLGDGKINLTNTTTSEKYVMLVPPENVGEETLNFGGAYEGNKTLANGIEANKFYGQDGPIEVTVTPKPIEFTVASGRTVEFSQGNLWYDGSKFKFESSQTAYTASWNAGHVDRFVWSPNKSVAVGTSTSVSGGVNDVFFTNAAETQANPAFTVYGETAGTWRTLSLAEWVYLLNTGGSSGRTDANRFAKAKVNGVAGLLIFPDGYTLPDGYTTADGGTGMAKVNITSPSDAPWPDDDIPTETWASMEASGVVFLPEAGYRSGTKVSSVGESGNYWASTNNGKGYAYVLGFYDSGVGVCYSDARSFGYSVRLVRDRV